MRLFRQILPKDQVEFSAFRFTGKTPLLNADFSININRTIEEEYHVKFFSTMEEGFNNNPDFVVISTPTSRHYDIALEAAKRKIDIFVEKPFSDNLAGFDDFRREVLKQGVRFFVSYQRRFHPQLMAVKNILSQNKLGKPVSAFFVVNSHVPSWHPYEDFRQLYACRKDLGGGVLLTEIHEIDLCYWYFGLPKAVYCSGGNRSGVRLDVEDTAQVTLDYGHFSVQLSMNFMHAPPRRMFGISGTDGFVEWNESSNTLTVWHGKDRQDLSLESDFSKDDPFMQQANYFLNGFERQDSSYLDSTAATLAIVEACRASMSSRTVQPIVLQQEE